MNEKIRVLDLKGDDENGQCLSMIMKWTKKRSCIVGRLKSSVVMSIKII
jgi:hypothetical protein